MEVGPVLGDDDPLGGLLGALLLEGEIVMVGSTLGSVDQDGSDETVGSKLSDGASLGPFVPDG